jgi:AcrB/AcrD/AcrF family
MGFAHFFVEPLIFASVCSILIVLIGLAAYVTLPVAQYPGIAPPTIQVTASYPGASAEVVSETVATPLEQEISGVDDVAIARLAVAERPSHGGDMDSEVALLDVDAGPDARDQLVLRDQFAGLLDHRAQDVERAAAKPDGSVVSSSSSSCRAGTSARPRRRPVQARLISLNQD